MGRWRCSVVEQCDMKNLKNIVRVYGSECGCRGGLGGSDNGYDVGPWQ